MQFICIACWNEQGKAEPFMAPVVVTVCQNCGRVERPCYDIAPWIGDRCRRHRLPYDVDNRCWLCFAEWTGDPATGVFRIECPV